MKQTLIKNKLDVNYAVKSNLADYKEVDENSRTVKAVANTYNFFDYDFDILRPGAAAKSIAERGAKSEAPDKILHALFHDLTRLPGKSMLEAETELNGYKVLYTESKLAETMDGEETLIKYLEGIYNQHSIGFRYTQIDYVEKDDSNWTKFIETSINPEAVEKVGFGYDVKEINLHEWSTVAFGANKLTPYLGTKSQNKNVQILNIYTKLDSLIKKANRCEVKDKKIFDLQYNQLKQMISELTHVESSPKDTAFEKGQPSASDTWDWASMKSEL